MSIIGDAIEKISSRMTKWKYAKMLDGSSPIFSQFGDNIFASDVVQQAINCIVAELKKLRVEHIIEKGTDIIPADSSLQTVLSNPNPLMTMSDFIEIIYWQLAINYNSFIIPVYYEWKDKKTGVVRRKHEGLYPIQPSQVDFIEDASKTLYIKFKFANGSEYIIKHSDVIHLKTHYSVNQYMGGNKSGQPDNAALLKTLNINHQLLQGVSGAMKASYAVNGVVKYKSLMDNGKTEAALQELEEKLKNRESGFLALDIGSEYIPIKKELKLVDAETLRFIDEKILRHFGVSLPILSGDFTKEQYEAFYQKTIEPLVISFSQEFTKVLFTDRERAHGNKIKFFPRELIFMSVSQTLEAVKYMGDRGAIYENEARVALGWRPLPELEGKRMQSLNYIDVDIAKGYQKNMSGGGEGEQ
jgi:HK97 family phage portal protein